MPLTHFPQEVKKFEIEAYKKRPENLSELKKTHVPFTGSPLKHPYDSEKIILVADPFSSNTFYYEFRTDDISHMEELPNLVNLEGDSIFITRLWVKKKRVGLRCVPFVVEDIKDYL
ncbi:inorganic pyrophosphatase Ppa [Desulfococcaceae bacterium HSG8]|nr:inorganic pyrophosphatase Ppa [Desulfococcaceae bacterium HSG8]